MALFMQPAFSVEVLKVESLSNFSTQNPPEYISLKAMSNVTLDENIIIPEGSIVKARLTDVKKPKRLKRNATFSVIPVSYTDEKGNEIEITEEYIGKFSPKFEIDKADLAKNAALTVGDYFVKGVSLGYHAVEGAVKNEEGNRLKSSAVSVYDNSPFSYIKKGNELEIKEHDLFSLRFKDVDINKKDELQPDQEVSESQMKNQNPPEEVKVKEKKTKKLKKEKLNSEKENLLPATDIKNNVEENVEEVINESEGINEENSMKELKLNEPSVHWVQEGVKGETFKFGREDY